MPSEIRLSNPQQEGRLQVSKWLKYQLLLDVKEMEHLLASLEPFSIYLVSEAVDEKNSCLAKAEFLRHYASYIEGLKKGCLVDEQPLRRYFSSIFSTCSELLYAMPVAGSKMLIKPLKPVVQLQLHHFFASHLDGQFYPMVLSDESTSWGIQFSYPQLYQDPKTQEIKKVEATEDFPNTQLFSKLVKWIRAHTQPTPFLFQGKKTNSPIRIGKDCFSWIENHPGLISRGLKVIV
ncbi:MAG TPA: hypothetical protein VLF61_03490 [Rhabdochlamydiaceae bacterium]|nr:hypothetical protein [Rhabdochlamydiaceae bacterium]